MKRFISNAIFRVDGGGNIGFGHLMRCLSLSQGLREKGIKCIFIIRDIDSRVQDKIKQDGNLVEEIPFSITLKEDLRLTKELIKRHKADLVITDSYEIDADYLKGLKELDVLLISIDDLAKLHFCSDIVLNQNLGAKTDDYSTQRYTRLLLGPQYALLRKEFRQRHAFEKRINTEVKNVLVTLGGSDPDNQTAKVVNALKSINFKGEVNVILGPSYKFEKDLQTLIKDSKVKFFLKKDPSNLIDLMQEADLAISGGGSTCYELACLGVPNITIVLADNQQKIAEELHKTGVSINLGWFNVVSVEQIQGCIESLIKDKEKRASMIKKGKSLVDGKGVQRVVDEILEMEVSN